MRDDPSAIIILARGIDACNQELCICVARVLLVECVKELEDGYTPLEVLQEHGVPLLQVGIYPMPDKRNLH